jgi:hypothetical protein
MDGGIYMIPGTARLFAACAALLIAASSSLAAGRAAAAGVPDDLTAKLDRIAAAIEADLQSKSSDLRGAAESLSRTGLATPEARGILSGLCAGHPSAVDCATVDAGGVMVAVEPAKYRSAEGSDISGQAHVARLRETRRPAMSEPFKAVEGFYAIDLEWPIPPQGKALKGAVSMIVRPRVFLDGIVKPELDRDTSDVWILETDGRIIYSRFRKDVGDNPLATPSLVSGATLTSLVRQIVADPSGRGQFETPPVGGIPPRIRRCAWKTIGVHDRQWRIAVFGDDEGN